MKHFNEWRQAQPFKLVFHSIEWNLFEWSVYYALTHTITKRKTLFQFWCCFCLHFLIICLLARSFVRCVYSAMCGCMIRLLLLEALFWYSVVAVGCSRCLSCSLQHHTLVFIFVFSRWLTSKSNVVVFYYLLGKKLLTRILSVSPIHSVSFFLLRCVGISLTIVVLVWFVYIFTRRAMRTHFSLFIRYDRVAFIFSAQ